MGFLTVTSDRSVSVGRHQNSLTERPQFCKISAQDDEKKLHTKSYTPIQLGAAQVSEVGVHQLIKRTPTSKYVFK